MAAPQTAAAASQATLEELMEKIRFLESKVEQLSAPGPEDLSQLTDQQLEDKAHELDEQIKRETVADKVRQLKQHKINVTSEIHDRRIKRVVAQIDEDDMLIDNLDDPKMPPSILVSFVDKLEEALRYFELKQLLRNGRVYDKKDLLERNYSEIVYNKLEPFCNDDDDSSLILFAVKGHLSEIQQPDQANISDWFAHVTPIMELGYQMHEKGYTLNKNPKVEIQKIKTSDPLFYNQRLLWEPPLMPQVDPKTTVAVIAASYVSNMDDFFSDCGKIVHYDRESGKRCYILHVTFEDPEGANKALSKDQGEADGVHVQVINPSCASKYRKPKDLRDFSDMESLAKVALEKYDELRNKYGAVEDVSTGVVSIKDAIEEGTSNKKQKGDSTNEQGTSNKRQKMSEKK